MPVYFQISAVVASRFYTVGLLALKYWCVAKFCPSGRPSDGGISNMTFDIDLPMLFEWDRCRFSADHLSFAGNHGNKHQVRHHYSAPFQLFYYNYLYLSLLILFLVFLIIINSYFKISKANRIYFQGVLGV